MSSNTEANDVRGTNTLKKKDFANLVRRKNNSSEAASSSKIKDNMTASTVMSSVVHQELAQLKLKLHHLLSHLTREVSDNVQFPGWLLHHQEICRTYRAMLDLSIDYVLDKRIEIEVWKQAFKAVISVIQRVISEKKKDKNREVNKMQALLSWFIDLAVGFYSSLRLHLQHRSAFTNGNHQAPSLSSLLCSSSAPQNEISKVDIKSFRYLHQHILLHLGDLERYRNKLTEAMTLYKKASEASPGSGQPFNQLALLEFSRGNLLMTVFYYMRAIALKHPFPSAALNMQQTLVRISKKTDTSKSQDSRSYVNQALYLLSLCNEKLKFKTAFSLASSINEECLTHCIAKDDLPQRIHLVRLIAIVIFMLDDCYNNNINESSTKTGLMSRQEVKTASVLECYLATLLSSLLLPVYTSQQGRALMHYAALPAVRVMLKWLAINDHVLRGDAFRTRRHIWPSVANLFNELSRSKEISKSTKTATEEEQRRKMNERTNTHRNGDRLVLPEDRELHLFTPLTPFNKKMDKQKRDKQGQRRPELVDETAVRVTSMVTELAPLFCDLQYLRVVIQDPLTFGACEDKHNESFECSEVVNEPSSEEDEVFKTSLLTNTDSSLKKTVKEDREISNTKIRKQRHLARNVAITSLMGRNKNSLDSVENNNTIVDYSHNKSKATTLRKREEGLDMSKKYDALLQKDSEYDAKLTTTTSSTTSLTPALLSPTMTSDDSSGSTNLHLDSSNPSVPSYSLFSGPTFHVWGGQQ